MLTRDPSPADLGPRWQELREGHWVVTKCAVQGKAHLDSNIPCQDCCAARTSADGKWVAAAVCDGAGSASMAQDGARIVAEGFASRVITIVPRIESVGVGPWIRDEIHRILIELRDELRMPPRRIHDHACTLVAMLLGDSGGFLVHVGDGLALAGSVCSTGDTPSDPIELWHGLVKSEPENGEYINETAFVTQDDWYAHLRTTPLTPDIDLVVLTSDGMMPLVLRTGAVPNDAFMAPVVSAMLKTEDPADRTRLLCSYLASPETYPCTSDDKSLVIVMRRKVLALANRPIRASAMNPSVESAAPSTGTSGLNLPLAESRNTAAKATSGDPMPPEKSLRKLEESSRGLPAATFMRLGVWLSVALSALALFLSAEALRVVRSMAAKAADLSAAANTSAAKDTHAVLPSATKDVKQEAGVQAVQSISAGEQAGPPASSASNPVVALPRDLTAPPPAAREQEDKRAAKQVHSGKPAKANH